MTGRGTNDTCVRKGASVRSTGRWESYEAKCMAGEYVPSVRGCRGQIRAETKTIDTNGPAVESLMAGQKQDSMTGWSHHPLQVRWSSHRMVYTIYLYLWFFYQCLYVLLEKSSHNRSSFSTKSPSLIRNSPHFHVLSVANEVFCVDTCHKFSRFHSKFTYFQSMDHVLFQIVLDKGCYETVK